MPESGPQRFAPLTGLLFIVLAIASFATFGDEPPDTDDPLREIVRFWTEDTDKLYASVMLQGLACVALVYFGTVLARALRQGGENDRLSLAAFAGTVILAAGLLFDATVILTLLESAEDLDPASVQLMGAIYENDFVPMAAGTLLIALSSGLAIVRTGVLPKWLGWIALLLALVTPTPLGFAGFIGTGLWIAVTGVLLTMRGREAPATV
jgi:hypothetical protein